MARPLTSKEIDDVLGCVELDLRLGLEDLSKDLKVSLDVAVLAFGCGHAEGEALMIKTSVSDFPSVALANLPVVAKSLKQEVARFYGDSDSMFRDRDLEQKIHAATRDAFEKGMPAFRTWSRLAGTLESRFVLVLLRTTIQAYREFPRLVRTNRELLGNPTTVTPSLLDGAAQVFLDKATSSLLHHKGGGYRLTGGLSSNSILQEAGELLMMNVCAACGDGQDGQNNGLFQRFRMLNEVSRLKYERAEGRGQIVFAHRDNPNLRNFLSFCLPTELGDARAVRKLLEASGGYMYLHYDGYEVQGVVEIEESYDGEAEDLLVVQFLGQSKWSLSHRSMELMRVEFEIPMRPVPSDYSEFIREFNLMFPGSEIGNDLEGILEQTDFSHGAIVVFTEEAGKEAERFGSQATRLEPASISAELLTMGARVDGAILASRDGDCHAIGVILDGKANPALGSAARGSRYNSTVRYINDPGRSGTEALALVVSEDGMVNVISPTPL